MTGNQTCNYGVDEGARHVSEPLGNRGENIDHLGDLLKGTFAEFK